MTGTKTGRAEGLWAYQGIDAVILLPTLNEEGGLRVTVEDLPLTTLKGRGWNAKPLILDGGSTDRTREVAAELGIPVVPQASRGKGAAIREGLELLRRLGVRFAVVLDADATYPGSAVLPALELLDSGSDLVVGVRQPETDRPRTFRDVIHRVGNVLLNFAASQYSRSMYLDLTSGFWAINVQKAHELELATDDFGIEAELFLKAHRNGWNASQIPIVYRERVGLAKLHALPDGMRILLSIIRYGRQSLQTSAPTLAETPTILRDLLLTAFINGHHDVVLLCPPGLQPEARAMADRLRRTGLFPRVVVGKPAKDAPSPAQGAAGAVATASPGLAGAEGGISVRFGPRGRLLYVTLTGVEPAGTPDGIAEPNTDVSKSGAFAGRGAGARADFLDPLRVMGHQLDMNPVAQRRRLLSANRVAVGELSEKELTALTEARIGKMFRGS
ncbi:MAG: glycosyltransferase family 2 protein [Thermoplasmata archaeon]